MADEEARAIYERARLGQGLQRGHRPAVLVVDFTCGFTDPACSVGSDLAAEIAATNRLLAAARAKRVPVIFTTIAFAPDLKDAGIWTQKIPGLAELVVGSRWADVDPRLEPRPDETIIVKKGASAFFGTNLSAILVSDRVDTVLLCGATTSGCIRATAIDLLQYGFPTLVTRECVGDRARGPHEANLFDLQAKYADVISLDEALAYVDTVEDRPS